MAPQVQFTSAQKMQKKKSSEQTGRARRDSKRHKKTARTHASKNVTKNEKNFCTFNPFFTCLILAGANNWAGPKNTFWPLMNPFPLHLHSPFLCVCVTRHSQSPCANDYISKNNKNKYLKKTQKKKKKVGSERNPAASHMRKKSKKNNRAVHPKASKEKGADKFVSSF